MSQIAIRVGKGKLHSKKTRSVQTCSVNKHSERLKRDFIALQNLCNLWRSLLRRQYQGYWGMTYIMLPDMSLLISFQGDIIYILLNLDCRCQTRVKASRRSWFHVSRVRNVTGNVTSLPLLFNILWDEFRTSMITADTGLDGVLYGLPLSILILCPCSVGIRKWKSHILIF